MLRKHKLRTAHNLESGLDTNKYLECLLGLGPALLVFSPPWKGSDKRKSARDFSHSLPFTHAQHNGRFSFWFSDLHRHNSIKSCESSWIPCPVHKSNSLEFLQTLYSEARRRKLLTWTFAFTHVHVLWRKYGGSAEFSACLKAAIQTFVEFVA